ncbi:MAG: hypothetical protein U0625_00705 [Phycisphaerales bacterium]
MFPLACDTAIKDWKQKTGSPRRIWTATGSPDDRQPPGAGFKFVCYVNGVRTDSALEYLDCSPENTPLPCPSVGANSEVLGGPATTGLVETVVEFEQPMAAVWVELAPGGGCSGPCGVRFQRADGAGWTTVASLRQQSSCGGVLVDVDAMLTASPPLDSLQARERGIRRVVFQWLGGTPGCMPRMHEIHYRLMDTALDLRAASRPYRLDVVGNLAEISANEPDAGSVALAAAWPSTNYRMRMNGAGIVCGTTQVPGPLPGSQAHLRATVWTPDPDPDAPTGWSAHDLEPQSPSPSYDLLACALTEPFEATLAPQGTPVAGRWVVVGGGRAFRCTGQGSNDPASCDNVHARAWLVRIDAAGTFVASFPIAIVGPTGGHCDSMLVDESTIEDLRVIPGPGNSVTVLGTGLVGMWCGMPNGNDNPTNQSAVFDIRGLSKPAAGVFVIDPGSLNGYTRVLDRQAGGQDEFCRNEVPPNPHPNDTNPRWAQISRAHAWVRGAAPSAAQPAYSALGEMTSVNGDCDPVVTVWCSWQWSARQWGFTELPGPYIANSPPEPWITNSEWRRTPAAYGIGPVGGQNVVRGFALMDGVRSAVPMADGTRQVVSAAGWLVDGCTDETLCPCNPHAMLAEFIDGPGPCWPANRTTEGERQLLQTDGTCVRELDLHAALWTAGTLGGSPEFESSMASAVAEIGTAATEFRRMVTGVRFNKLEDRPNAIDQRAVLWCGRATAQALGSGLIPESLWCGRDIGDIIVRVRWLGANASTDVIDARWSELYQPRATNQDPFAPAVLSAHGVDPMGKCLVIAKLASNQPYVAARISAVADLSGDDTVNGADLGILLGAWGSDGPSDITGDGVVNGADLGALLGSWTSGGPIPIDLRCSNAEQSSRSIALVQRAVVLMGFESFGALGDTLSVLPPQTALFLGEAITQIAQQLPENGDE